MALKASSDLTLRLSNDKGIYGCNGSFSEFPLIIDIGETLVTRCCKELGGSVRSPQRCLQPNTLGSSI